MRAIRVIITVVICCLLCAKACAKNSACITLLDLTSLSENIPLCGIKKILRHNEIKLLLSHITNKYEEKHSKVDPFNSKDWALYPQHSTFSFILFVFGDSGNQTYNLTLARQALHY